MNYTLEELKALREGVTSGPWSWRGENTRNSEMPKHAYLRSDTPNTPRYIVMDFVRQEMQGAQPRFRHEKPSIMRPISEVGNDWSKHPDAQVIAAAPSLLSQLIATTERLAAAEAREAGLREVLEKLRDYAVSAESAGLARMHGHLNTAPRMAGTDGTHAQIHGDYGRELQKILARQALAQPGADAGEGS